MALGIVAPARAIDAEVQDVKAAPENIYRQVEPDSLIANEFAQISELSVALAAVPDPRVPRHRRAYDLAIVAIIQGMLDSGFVLDRYSFPWQEALARSHPDTSHVQTDDCGIGVMIFRHDAWRRKDPDSYPSLRVLYVVPETTTYGLPMRTTLTALAEASKQVHGSAPSINPCGCKERESSSGNESACATPSLTQLPQPKVTGAIHFARHADCPTPTPAYRDEVLLLGPNFSGSVDSLAQVSARASRLGLPQICAISASATATSNSRSTANFVSFAKSDDAKLAALWALAQTIGAARDRKIAILYEYSVFGSEVCPTGVYPRKFEHRSSMEQRQAAGREALCEAAMRISFASNIADVRVGVGKAKKEATTSSLRNVLPAERHLSGQEGVGNGSEFPDSFQSELTAAGTEIELRRAIRILRASQPRMIIVVATDVRDRLFLFDMLRDEVPSAQLVDLEADAMLVHRDHILATRGAVAVASAKLMSGMERQVLSIGSTDWQLVLRNVLQRIDCAEDSPTAKCPDPPPDRVLPRDTPILHVVGRKSLVPMNSVLPREVAYRLVLAPLFGILALLLIISASPLVQALRPIGMQQRPATGFASWREAADGNDPWLNPSLPRYVLAGICLFVAAWFTEVANTKLLAIFTVPLAVWALSYQSGMYAWNRPYVPGESPTRQPKARIRRHLLAVAAIVLTLVMSAKWVQLAVDSQSLASAAFARLAFATHQGLAIGLLLIIAVIALIYGDNALAVARTGSERNCYVMMQGLGEDKDDSRFAKRAPVLYNPRAFPFTAAMALGSIALLGCVVTMWPIKVTIFGALMSYLPALAIAALSYLALSFLANAMRLRERALWAASTIIAMHAKSGGKDVIGLWPPAQALHVRFATTPAVARLKDAGEAGVRLLAPERWPEFGAGIRRAASGNVDLDARIALYTLFASEVSQTRWATFSSIACSLAAISCLYLFPASGSNAFALFNVALVLIVGLFAGYTAMTFERDEVMSNVLCNRPKKIEFSATLFTYTAFPFIVLALCLAIVQVPGVLDWSEGLFRSLLNATGGKLWTS
jgi:hypothetical protein